MNTTNTNLVFNINNIPSGPVTYPPGSTVTLPATNAPVSKILSQKGNNKVKSIFKPPSNLAGNQVVGKTIKKKVVWSPTNSARLIKKNRVINEQISANKTFVSFAESKGVKQSKPGRDESPSSVWSRDPEDVKEVKAIFRESIKYMEDERLLKNHQRLVTKQECVFCERSKAFQDIIQKYIKQYANEIKKRNL